MSDDENTWELAVPFVACRSQDGPYDDLSFAAGFELGQLDERMRTGDRLTITANLRGPSFRQLDLLAMYRGWILVMLAGPDVDPDDEEWIECQLAPDPSPVAAPDTDTDVEGGGE